MINNIAVIISLFSCVLLFSCKQKSANNTSNQEVEKVTKITSKKIDKLPYFNTPDFTPTWLPNTEQLKEFHKIPNFSLINQLGDKITNKTFKGHIYIANFFFTSCPNICIQLTQNMGELQKIYADDDQIKLLSHTVMPSVDTVEILEDYGKRHDIDPKKWHLVTGKKETIYALAREAYFADDLYKKTNDKDRFIHTENLVLVDKNGHIRGVYSGTQSKEVKRIKRHIELLKKESIY